MRLLRDGNGITRTGEARWDWSEGGECLGGALKVRRWEKVHMGRLRLREVGCVITRTGEAGWGWSEAVLGWCLRVGRWYEVRKVEKGKVRNFRIGL